jgi:NAD(P)-dependent dehydrogenase (short-subunit alcohol dehydrogenase family)
VTSPTMVRELDGKVALVTGATSGIGKAAAVQLAAQGATVIVHGRDVTRGAAVVAQIVNGGGSARFVGADLGEPSEALLLAEEVGDVDILVNNAGFAWFGPSEKLAVNTLDQLFAANVQAPYLLVSVLAPKMVARGEGVIINIASRAGSMGQPDSAAYGATKAALAYYHQQEDILADWASVSSRERPRSARSGRGGCCRRARTSARSPTGGGSRLCRVRTRSGLGVARLPAFPRDNRG